MRPGAGCHPRSSSLTLVEAVAGERVGDGDGEAGVGYGGEDGGGRRRTVGAGLIASGGGKMGHTEEMGVYGTLQMGPTSRPA